VGGSAPGDVGTHAGLHSAVASAFADDGPLARSLPGYEPREGQRRMAEAVAAAIDGGGTLLAEAGTGTGKTLAYLIPAILSRHRLLVSTGTKNLQEQIYFKDLPALQEALGVRFTATLMKGRGNYLCLHRLHALESSDGAGTAALFDSSDRAALLPVIREWAARTDTGDRAELDGLPEHLPLWKEVAAEADTCLGRECPHYADCFVTRMRQRAAEADVVIVNHHLLCADAAVRQSDFGEVIPACPTLVVDEAHQLEDVATQYFGVSLSALRIDDLVTDGQRMLAAGRPGWRRDGAPRRRDRGSRRMDDADRAEHATLAEEGGFSPRQHEEILRALTRVADRAKAFFTGLTIAAPAGQGSEARVRYTADQIGDRAEAGRMLEGALDGLEATIGLALGTGREPALSPETSEAAEAIQRRAGEVRSDLRFLLRADDPNFVYFAEARPRGVFLRASPIDVSAIVREAVFDRYRTIVLTSATLAVDRSFAYVERRLGIRGAGHVLVESEFDYARQALLYLPARMPLPSSPRYAEAVAREAIALLTRSRGRAFVLFTSYRVLQAAQRFLEMALPYPLLVQGTAPRSALIDRFRSTPHAVLLATSSFWQGVDVVGEALSCVVIDKLPFASPGDPVTSARIDAVAANGGDAFDDYQVPRAILALQQGLGRLIRHRGDRGVLAILDPRLLTRGYGQRFLASIPPARVTRDLDAVDRFFK
jgi:ATP-dependent DNA helicase DinG